MSRGLHSGSRDMPTGSHQWAYSPCAHSQARRLDMPPTATDDRWTHPPSARPGSQRLDMSHVARCGQGAWSLLARTRDIHPMCPFPGTKTGHAPRCQMWPGSMVSVCPHQWTSSPCAHSRGRRLDMSSAPRRGHGACPPRTRRAGHVTQQAWGRPTRRSQALGNSTQPGLRS